MYPCTHVHIAELAPGKPGDTASLMHARPWLGITSFFHVHMISIPHAGLPFVMSAMRAIILMQADDTHHTYYASYHAHHPQHTCADQPGRRPHPATLSHATTPLMHLDHSYERYDAHHTYAAGGPGRKHTPHPLPHNTPHAIRARPMKCMIPCHICIAGRPVSGHAPRPVPDRQGRLGGRASPQPRQLRPAVRLTHAV